VSLRLRYLLLGALIAFMGVAGQWVDSAGVEYAWRVFALLAIIALAYEHQVNKKNQLTIEVDAPQLGYLGRSQSVAVHFTNTGNAPAGIQCRFMPQADLGLSDRLAEQRIAPGETLHEEFSILPVALGRQALPALQTASLGCFGLAWWKRVIKVTAIINVVPDVVATTAATPGSRAAGTREIKATGGGLELYGLRPYRPGDPRRSIDWKATAKSSQLITRLCSFDQHLEIMIAIDASVKSQIHIDGLSRLGHYANLATSLTNFAISNEDRVGLLVYARDTLALRLPDRGVRCSAAIRKLLGEVTTQTTESTPLPAMLKLRAALKHRSLVVILTATSEQGSADQLRQATQLLLPKHSVLVVGIDDAALHTSSNRPATRDLDPYLGLVSADQLHSQAIARRVLERSGCRTVTASPGQLEQKVLVTYQQMRARHQV
jgi:uncharacterized protein (DUF58 family)